MTTPVVIGYVDIDHDITVDSGHEHGIISIDQGRYDVLCSPVGGTRACVTGTPAGTQDTIRVRLGFGLDSSAKRFVSASAHHGLYVVMDPSFKVAPFMIKGRVFHRVVHSATGEPLFPEQS